MIEMLEYFVEFGVLDVLFNSSIIGSIDIKYLIFINEDDGSNMENMFLIIFKLFSAVPFWCS